MKTYPKTFSQAFFDENRKLLCFLLNNFAIGWLMRRLLKITLPMCEKIAFVHPNGYTVHLHDDFFRAELYANDHISVQLNKRFSVVFKLFHWFDMHIANRFFPALNLGFDQYNDVSVDLVVAGTVSKGYSNYDYKYTFSEIRTSTSAEGASSNNRMIVRLLSSDWGRYCLMQRGIIAYNTSFLSENDVISEASLRLYLVNPVNYTSSLDNDNLVIVSHSKVTSYAYDDNDLVTDDYNVGMFGNGSYSELSWDDYTSLAPGVYEFPLNESGINHIKRKAHTSFGLRLKMDIQITDPVGNTGDETFYIIDVPAIGTGFLVSYRSREKQIVMMM